MGATKALKSLTKTFNTKNNNNSSKNNKDCETVEDDRMVSKNNNNGKSKTFKNIWQTKNKRMKDKSDSLDGYSNPGGDLKVFLSPITFPETEASPSTAQQEPEGSNYNNREQRKYYEMAAPSFQITEVLTFGKDHSLNVSPLSIHTEPNELKAVDNDDFAADTLKMPSFNHPQEGEQVRRVRSTEPAITIPNSRRRIRAYGVSARRQGAVSDEDIVPIIRRPKDEHKKTTTTTDARSDESDVVFSNHLETLPNVFGNLQTLLDDVPDGNLEQQQQVNRNKNLRETNEAVLQRETAKGKVGDPIDLTNCDYRLFLRKPADAVAVGLVEDADEAYTEMINASTSILTKATYMLFGANGTWYRG
eukprot:scaffold8444_cov56-Cylindrotheca_fusiformis.AAC.3